MSKMSGGFLAVQAKRSKERTKVNQRSMFCQLTYLMELNIMLRRVLLLIFLFAIILKYFIKVVELENAFRAADKDKSGRISLEEWIEVLRASGQDVSRYTYLNIYCK